MVAATREGCLERDPYGIRLPVGITVLVHQHGMVSVLVRFVSGTFHTLYYTTMRAPILLLSLTFATLVGRAQSTSPDTLTSAPPQTADVVVKELSPTQLSAMLATDTLFIYDCNEPDMFAEAHVPGAKLIVYDEVTAESLPADRTATLVFYCYSQECPAGTTAARTAMSFGYTDVYSMIAGITGWQDAGLPTEP